tara:strand:- start:1057 stop:1221 length:165 start_codon:yes stop_codon:yes gene_type:complete
MSKKLVLDILNECVLMQQHANEGGIEGGKEEQKMAQKDLARFKKARDWFKEKCK